LNARDGRFLGIAAIRSNRTGLKFSADKPLNGHW
jgi:hypothetical protein